MNSALEQGLREYLKGQLSGGTVTIGSGTEAFNGLACTISGKSVSLHCNIGQERMPQDRSWIVIAVPDCARIVGKLHNAMVGISVCTPSNISGVTDADHRAVITAVRACFPDMPTLYQNLAHAVGAPAIATAQAALNAGLARVTACATALAASASVTISGTSPWFMDAARDGIMKQQERWESISALKMSVLG